MLSLVVYVWVLLSSVLLGFTIYYHIIVMRQKLSLVNLFWFLVLTLIPLLNVMFTIFLYKHWTFYAAIK